MLITSFYKFESNRLNPTFISEMFLTTSSKLLLTAVQLYDVIELSEIVTREYKRYVWLNLELGICYTNIVGEGLNIGRELYEICNLVIFAYIECINDILTLEARFMALSGL